MHIVPRGKTGNKSYKVYNSRSYYGISAIVLRPIKPIMTTEVNMPRIENIIAINPVKICPLKIPTRPKMKARGDRIKESAKIPTKPIITPHRPNLVSRSITKV
tara:strand:+ start:2815 stop:3123 length:309 start_codon:yes stop_codon:yes gene_type:complete